MNSKFKNLSVEDDTKILFSEDMKFENFDVHYEKWAWEGTLVSWCRNLGYDALDQQVESIAIG